MTATLAPTRTATLAPTRTPTALIYARVSQDPKQKGRSVAEQERDCRQWAERERWDLLEPVIDNGISASRHGKKKRPGWEQVKAALATGTVDILLMWEASRAQRNLTAYTELRDLCTKYGVKLAYSGTVYDLSDRSDRFRTGMDALVAENEAEQTRERVMRAMRENADQGRPHGRIPFGYRREYLDKELVGQFIREDQACLIREAASRVLAAESSRSIANDWNARGIPTPSDPAWNPGATRESSQWGWQLGQIRRILVNPAVNGQRVHQGEPVGPGNWEAILDDVTFTKLQAHFSDKGRNTIRQRITTKLLTGVARCGICGGPLAYRPEKAYTPKNAVEGKVRNIYACRYGGHVYRDMVKLDDYVETFLLEKLKNSEIGLPDESDASILEARTQVNALRKKLEEALAGYHAGVVTLTLLGRIESETMAQIKAIERTIKVASIPTSAIDLVASDDPETYWDGLTTEQRREILRATVEVVVYRTIKPRGPGGFEKESISLSIIPRLS